MMDLQVLIKLNHMSYLSKYWEKYKFMSKFSHFADVKFPGERTSLDFAGKAVIAGLTNERQPQCKKANDSWWKLISHDTGLMISLYFSQIYC